MMDLGKISDYLKLAELAIEYRRAQNYADGTKDDYHMAWRRFECGGEDPEDFMHDALRITRGHKEWDDVVAATAPEYAIYQQARKAAYNAKRRFNNAVRRLA